MPRLTFREVTHRAGWHARCDGVGTRCQPTGEPHATHTSSARDSSRNAQSPEPAGPRPAARGRTHIRVHCFPRMQLRRLRCTADRGIQQGIPTLLLTRTTSTERPPCRGGSSRSTRKPRPRAGTTAIRKPTAFRKTSTWRRRSHPHSRPRLAPSIRDDSDRSTEVASSSIRTSRRAPSPSAPRAAPRRTDHPRGVRPAHQRAALPPHAQPCTTHHSVLPGSSPSAAT